MSKEINSLEKSGLDRKSGISRTLFKDTLARALLADDSKQLRRMCEELLSQSLDKNLAPSERLAAIKLIIERVDGRPAQSIEVSDSSDRPSTGVFKIVKVEPN